MSIKKEIDYGKWKMIIEINNAWFNLVGIIITAIIYDEINAYRIYEFLDCSIYNLSPIEDTRYNRIVYSEIVSNDQCVSVIKHQKKIIEEAIQNMHTAYAEEEKKALEAFEKIKTELSML